MNLDLYSDRAKQAVQSAQSLAPARRHQQFAPEHLPKVLLEERAGLARTLINAAGGDVRRAEADVEAALAAARRDVEPLRARERDACLEHADAEIQKSSRRVEVFAARRALRPT